MSTPLSQVDTGPRDDTDDAPHLRSIVLCAVPGSDEQVVADGLADRLGSPVRAWFDVERVAPALLEQWGVTDLDEYVAALHRTCTTPDGRFGMVLHWHDLRRLHRQVAGLRQPTAQRMLDIVETIAPAPTFVRVTRADRARHIAALHAARQPRAAQEPPAPGTPDHARLDALISATETVWTQWFDAIGTRPATLTTDADGGAPQVADELVPAATG